MIKSVRCSRSRSLVLLVHWLNHSVWLIHLHDLASSIAFIVIFADGISHMNKRMEKTVADL